MGNCCFFKSAQVNHRSSTTLISSTPGTSKPNNNGGGFVGSNLANSRLSKNSSFEELYPNVHILPTPNLKIYSFAELKIATKNFRQDTVLGEGGFGTVYKGLIEEKSNSKMGSGSVVAVKKLNSEGMQGLEEGQSEVNFLGRLSHPNLVKLLGYCLEDKELLLVYEFIQKGSLENHLFRNESNNFPIPFKVQDLNGKLKKVVKPKVGNPTYGFDFVQGGSTFQPLAWNMRLKIALGAARGLAFLHTSEKTTMYREFTASNILLDGNYNPKLSDFGLAKNGPLGSASHVTTRVMGTYGYAAPEYIATGHLYVKSDVFGFGVVLLEMLSGQRAVDKNRPSGLHNLVDLLKPSLADRRKLKTIMDPRLEGQYPPKAAVQAADLTLKCLGDEPRVRPSMKEVVEALERIVAIRVRPKESRPGATRSAGHRHVQHHHCSPINPMHEGTGTSQNSGSELKKMIKKSRSIKRSDPVTSTKRRTKPQSTNKSPPPTDVPVAAPVSTPKKLNLVKLPETSPMRSTPIKLRDASPNHMKPTPVKLPDASPNYMKSTTSSYNARKERSQVSPQGLVMRMV